MIKRKTALVIAATAAALAVTAGTALAATSSSAPPQARIACVEGPARTLANAYENVPAGYKCPSGWPVSLSGTGTQGPAGPAGPKGDTGATGAQGPSGVQQVTSETGSATLTAIGGSWTAGHTAVKTFTLGAGTYLVTLTGDFYRTAPSTATPVLQIQLNGADKQLTGYTGAFAYDPAEAVGTGSDGSPNGLEQTATAVGIITLTQAATVEADAFGYNPDRGGEGGGDFGVKATADIVQLTPAS